MASNGGDLPAAAAGQLKSLTDRVTIRHERRRCDLSYLRTRRTSMADVTVKDFDDLDNYEGQFL